MEIEEKLNEFMEMAYTSIEETMYYPTIVNDIHDILKTYNAELKKRKLIFKFNILVDSNDNEEIKNYFILFENFMRFGFKFDNFVKINSTYDRSCLADYMLQNNDECLNNIKEAVKVLTKKDEK